MSLAVPDDSAPQDVSLSTTFMGSLDDESSFSMEEADVERFVG